MTIELVLPTFNYATAIGTVPTVVVVVVVAISFAIVFVCLCDSRTCFIHLQFMDKVNHSIEPDLPASDFSR